MTLTRKFFLSFCALVVAMSLMAPVVVNAAYLGNNGEPAGSPSQGLVPCGSFSNNPCQLTDVFSIIIIITNFLIGLGGIIAVVAIAFAGWSLATAAGNIEAVTAAKKLLVNAVIGFFLVMVAFAAANLLIFGGRGVITDEPIQNGRPAGIFVCPIDYILGNPECGGGGSANNANNAPANNAPALPFSDQKIPPMALDTGISGENAGLEIPDPPPHSDTCFIGSIKPRTTFSKPLENLFFKTAEAAEFCNDPTRGYLSGPRQTRDFPVPLEFQQNYNDPLGWTDDANTFHPCDNMKASGCGVIAMVHAYRYLIYKGHTQLGTWAVNSHSVAGSQASRLTNIDDLKSVGWWVKEITYQKNAFHCKTATSGAVAHSTPAWFTGRGDVLADIMAEEVTEPTQWLSRINDSIAAEGVAIANVGTTNGKAIFTSGAHYVLIWDHYARTDNGEDWYSIADSNQPRQIGQVRADILKASIRSFSANDQPSVTLIFPFR